MYRLPGGSRSACPLGQLGRWCTRSPGELTRNPYSDAFALSWVDEAALTIPTPGRQAFVTLGQFSPIQASSYRIAFDVSFQPLPSDTWQHVSMAFGHSDDQYYEHRLGDTAGYHALLRADGTMALYAHVEGDENGQELGRPKASTPLKSGVVGTGHPRRDAGRVPVVPRRRHHAHVPWTSASAGATSTSAVRRPTVP